MRRTAAWKAADGKARLRDRSIDDSADSSASRCRCSSALITAATGDIACNAGGASRARRGRVRSGRSYGNCNSEFQSWHFRGSRREAASRGCSGFLHKAAMPPVVINNATVAPLLASATKPGATLSLRALGAVAITDDAIDAVAATHLRKVDVSENALTSLSGLHRLSQVTWLNAADNALVGHALVDVALLQELAFLNVGGCAIESMPAGSLAGQGRSLRALLLNNNKLTELRHIGHLAALNTLVASHNRLRCIDSCVLRLASLAKLSLSHNRITALPDLSTLRSLAELRLAHNSIEEIPASVAALAQSLRVLDIGSNRFTTWESLASLALLPRLVNLSIRGNPVTLGVSPAEVEARMLALCPALSVLDGRRVMRPRDGHVSTGARAATVVARAALASAGAGSTRSASDDADEAAAESASAGVSAQPATSEADGITAERRARKRARHALKTEPAAEAHAERGDAVVKPSREPAAQDSAASLAPRPLGESSAHASSRRPLTASSGDAIDDSSAEVLTTKRQGVVTFTRQMPPVAERDGTNIAAILVKAARSGDAVGGWDD